MIVIELFIRHSLKSFSDQETEKDIATFFVARDNSGYNRTLAVISDTILSRAAYKERDADALLEWLKANGHA